MKKFLIVITLLLILCSTLAAKPANHHNSLDEYAIIIGYGDDINADNGARLVKKTLTHEGFKCDTFIDSNATSSNLNEAIQDIGQRDVVVIYLAGHGSARSINLSGGLLYYSTLLDWLNEYTSSDYILIVMVESCHSGGIIVDGVDGINLGGENRIILSSTDEDNYSYSSSKGGLWTIRICRAIDQGNSIQDAQMYAVSYWGRDIEDCMLDSVGEFYL